MRINEGFLWRGLQAAKIKSTQEQWNSFLDTLQTAIEEVDNLGKASEK